MTDDEIKVRAAAVAGRVPWHCPPHTCFQGDANCCEMQVDTARLAQAIEQAMREVAYRERESAASASYHDAHRQVVEGYASELAAARARVAELEQVLYAQTLKVLELQSDIEKMADPEIIARELVAEVLR